MAPKAWLALKPIQARHIVVSREMTGATSCMRCFSAASRGASFGPMKV